MSDSGFIHKGKYALLCGIAVGALAYSVPDAVANPIGGHVVAGDAVISSSGSTTTIQQFSNQAIIEWQDFSIDPGELTQFLQNGKNSAVLNKVISNLPSSILGQLKANGNVFLINPNGVVIGGGAQINANSFIASTLNVSNADFMAGGDLNFQGESTAAIINLGEIKAGKGDVFLLARQIKNAGRISAPQGEVGLAAGSEIYLSTTRSNGSRITVKANKFAAELKDKIAIENTGAIEAARAILSAYNGDIYDLAINNTGTIRATGLSKRADGTIRLFARGDNNKTSGKIRNSGRLTAQNMDGTGGSVTISGKKIALTKSSLIDVSASPTYKQPIIEVAEVIPPTPSTKPNRATADNRGDTGAGTILIGGDYQGKGDVATAQMVTIENGSTIKANAGLEGDGGKVVVWADQDTRAAGTIEAKGGAESGNGGFIETSGKNILTVDSDTIIDVSATNGKGGQWLLDPTDITISDGGGDVDTATINATLNSGGDVTITTVSGGGDDGDITLNNANIFKTSGGDATFSLVAERNIGTVGTNTINSNTGALTVVLNSNSDSVGGGNVDVRDTTINTNGGDFIIGGGADPLVGYAEGFLAGEAGINLSNVQVNASTGSVFLRGDAADDVASSSQIGIQLRTGTTIETTTGLIDIDGIGGAGEDYNYGVLLADSGTLVTSSLGAINITGQGGSNGSATGRFGFGVAMQTGADITSTGTGVNAATINIDGTGGDGQSGFWGTYLINDGTSITSIDGDINITGQGGSNGLAGSATLYGIYVRDNADIISTGMGINAANITLNGIGGAGEDSNYGVYLTNTGSSITTVDGDISITGQGGSNGLSGSDNNFGFSLNASARLESTGVGANAGRIMIDGTAGDGDSTNRGVLLGGGTQIVSTDGDISITGQGGSNGAAGSNSNVGVLLSAAQINSIGTTSDAATITIDGTGGAGEDSNNGVRMQGASLIDSNLGAINITGQGGSNGSVDGNSNVGVSIEGASIITSTGVGENAATITIDGTGGAGDDNNYGINVSNAGTSITSAYGDISLTGQGGSNGLTSSVRNYGVFSDQAIVESTGTGVDAANIIIDGTGGAGESFNYGVLFDRDGTLSDHLTAIDGDISITGQGGSNGSMSSGTNIGVYVNDGYGIRSFGVGDNAALITIDGTGGSSGVGGNRGVRFEDSAYVTSVDGDVSITGVSDGPAGSSNNDGIVIFRGSTISSTGISTNAATITIDGTGGAGEDYNYGINVSNAGTSITSAYGDISLTGQGGSNGLTGSNVNYGVFVDSSAEIRSTGLGTNAAKITLDGVGGAGEDYNRGFYVASLITSIDGDILIKGQGGSNGLAGSAENTGGFLGFGGVISSTGVGTDAATITIDGTGGAGEDGNRGITFQDTNTLVTSVDGDIHIIGQGGSNGSNLSNSNYGVGVSGGADIRSTGTGANAATITIDATAGAGEDANDGIRISTLGTEITSIDGNIIITGQGGSNGDDTSGTNDGVNLFIGGLIESLGTTPDAATITLNGTGGAGGSSNRGVILEAQSPESVIRSAYGDITLTGKGGTNGNAGGASNIGVYLVAGEIISTGVGADAAKITLNGTGGAGEDTNFGVNLADNGPGLSLITTVDGDILLTGQGGSNGLSGSNENHGVQVRGGSIVQSTGTGGNAATITFDGTGGSGEDSNYGVSIIGVGTNVTSVGGDVSITGQGGSNGAAGSNVNLGVAIIGNSSISSTGVGADAAKITLNGTGGTGEDTNAGVWMNINGNISSVDGAIDVTGLGGSNGTVASGFNYGIAALNGSTIVSTGSGVDAATITLNGTGGAGDDNNYGVHLNGTGAEVTSVDGAIDITGQGGSNGLSESDNNNGINMASLARVTSTGTGANAATITLDGTGGAGEGANRGISIASQIISQDGDISLTGQGQMNFTNNGPQGNRGVQITGSTTLISSTGTGADAANINIVGRGPLNAVVGDNNNDGVLLGGSAVIRSQAGDIDIFGDETNSNLDLRINNGVTVETLMATGEIRISGEEALFRDAPVISSAGDFYLTMDGPRFDGTASALNAGDNIYVKTFTEGESIGLGDGTGTLELTATELSYFNPTNRLIIGDSVAGTGAVDIDGVDIFANVIDVYGGDITLANLSNVDGSTSTFTARTGDLTLFDDLADSSVILDEIKANFTTLAGDLILAPETATNSIGINSAADFQFNNVDLSGFTNVAKNLILGDPTNGAGVVTIGALNFAALSPNTGIGFYGSNIAINGDIQSGGDILLGADGIAFNNFDLIADDDVIITTQNTALDIGVSGGTLGPIDITDAVIDDIFAGNDGTGNLIIGEAETGTGTIDIDGLDLTGAGYGLKLYGSTIDLNDASITTDADLTLGADTLTNFTTAVNANGVIEVAPQTAVLLDIDEPSNEFTLNGDTFSLALLNQGANLILGSSRGGDVTWTSATHDFAAIDARSGGNITLINTNAGTSYGLGDGTTGDVFYSTAQLEAINAGGTLILGNKISGTGVIDIADLSGADLGYGLDIAGGNIDIGGWNGDVGDLTLLARTGDITSTEGGLITGGLLNLNAAGNIGTAANRLNTSVNQIDYITGGDVYITEANAVTLNSGIQNGAGTVEIATLDGELSLPNALTFTGDVLLESGGENDLFVTQDLIFNATNEATLNLRAGRDLAILSTVSAIENTNGQALNVILNSDRNQNQNGAVFVDRVDINTNDGDLTIGGGLNPETTVAYGSVGTPYNDGVYLNSAVTTGAGNISIRGHGANGGRDNLGVGLIAATSLTTTTGDIYVNGEGGDGTFNNFGLSSGQNSAIVTESGSIDLIGRGGNGRSSSVTSGNNAYGLFIQNASRVTSTGVGPSVGDITITGTAGDQSYNAYGVRTDNTDITANSANINITGQGSNTIANDTNRGVFIRTGSVIRSTGTGDDAGEITIIGTGGTGQSGNDGVFLDDLGTLITSVEGDILITGQGGGNGQTDSNANHGVEIVSARIQSTGTGSNAATITIDGTAGLGEDSNQGVRISDAGGSVTAIDGDINITGYGGSNGQAESGSNYGVVVSNGGNITSTGTGENSSEITINGTGGIGNNTNYGVFVGGVGTFVTSLDGDINITGQGGSIGATNSNSNAGIRIDGGGIVSSGTGANAAKIILTGTGGAGEDSNHGITLDDNGTSLTSVDGDIILMGQGASNGQTEGISNYGVAVTDTSIIRSTGLGESAAKIIIDGIGGNGEDTNHGVFIASSTIESARADITLSGVGGTNGQTGSDANRGVVINNSVIESTNTFDDLNTITIDGIGGEGGNTNMGIDILSGAQIISNTNDIVINGIAKGNENISGDSNYGILLRSASEIISNGTGADAAKVTLNGTGGNGDDGNVGVLISNVGTEVQSVNGDISIVGVGGSNSRDGSNSNYGTSVVGGAVIKSTGTGDNAANIMFDGTGGQGQGGNYGFNATGLGTSIVTVDGDIDILGQGGVRGFESASAYGARIADTLVESTGNGDLNLTGVGGLSSTSSNFGLLLSDATEVKAAQGDIVLKGTDTSLGNNGVRIEDDLVISALGIDGDITFITDRFNTTDNPTITAGDTITIAPETSGQSIGVGGGSGYLNIVDTELGNLSAARIVFGQQGVNASSININTTTVNGGTDIEFYGDDVNISGNINGANNIFIQGTSITKTGVDLTSTGDITFSTDDLTITNAVRAGDNFYVRALDLDGTIGIGDATGQDLNLTAADFAFFDAVAGRVNVGSDDNTGTVFVDNFDITGETYDFGLYGGAIDIQNGLSVGGELLARATTGNIGVFDGQVNAFGQSVFDVQQGGFKTNQGTNIWNVTGGNYILYTDNVFNSDIASLEPLADFINGQNSISLPPATIGTVTDTVVLRQDLDTAIGSIAAPDLIADIQAPSQQANNLTPNDEVSANALPTLDSHIESPYLTQKPNPNTKISKAKLSGSAGELKTKLKASVNSKGVKGIGITNAECDVNNAKNIVCNQSGSASR